MKSGIVVVFIVVLAAALVPVMAASLLVHESFETGLAGRWDTTWGPVERTNERAQDGEWAVKQTLENEYGLSVLFTTLQPYPKATYRATAWVYIPKSKHDIGAALAFTNRRWNALARSPTTKTDQWVKLETVFENESEPFIRLQMFQHGPHRKGAGGSVMYWDNVSIEREIEGINMEDGIRINPYVKKGLDVTPAGGMKLTVAPGRIDVDAEVGAVEEETTITVPKARVMEVRDEPARLTRDKPEGYGKGTALKGCVPRGTTVAGCLDPDSLIVKLEKGSDGQRLEEGVDWRADKKWARVGRIPGGVIGADRTVYIDYRYSLLRLDTIEVLRDGTVRLRRGNDHLTTPHPPQGSMHARKLCNVLVPYHCTELQGEHIYPIGAPFPSAPQPQVQRRVQLIGNAVKKLEAGEDFTLVFWGDSVTCGGDASSQRKAFPQSFTRWLRNEYPQADIEYVNAGTGGWNSSSKLPLFEKEVISHEPDLVVIEFVNDMGMGRETIFDNYSEAMSRIQQVGGEAIIILPHFVRPDWMGPKAGMRTKETRETIRYLREFAEENDVATADASRRWEHLWIEGLPYMTLLYNAINHPDDRGHQLFVEELQKCFPQGRGESG